MIRGKSTTDRSLATVFVPLIVNFSLRCYSMVGRQPGRGAQRISIGRGCEQLGVVVHEIGMEMIFASVLCIFSRPMSCCVFILFCCCCCCFCFFIMISYDYASKRIDCHFLPVI